METERDRKLRESIQSLAPAFRELFEVSEQAAQRMREASETFKALDKTTWKGRHRRDNTKPPGWV